MLANLNEVWKLADEKKIAIGAFNIVNFENILAVLDTAEKLNMPVILAFAQTHEENNVMNLDTIGPVMVLMAQRAKVPVVVHLDHGVNLDYIEKSLKMGFTSVMFDGFCREDGSGLSGMFIRNGARRIFFRAEA